MKGCIMTKCSKKEPATTTELTKEQKIANQYLKHIGFLDCKSIGYKNWTLRLITKNTYRINIFCEDPERGPIIKFSDLLRVDSNGTITVMEYKSLITYDRLADLF
jgi:hypothetical protein